MTYCNGCNNRIKEMPFMCKFCGYYHCGNCRLPENHHCAGLRRGNMFNNLRGRKRKRHNRNRLKDTRFSSNFSKPKALAVLAVIITIMIFGVYTQTTPSYDAVFNSEYEAPSPSNISVRTDEINSTNNSSKEAEVITNLNTYPKETDETLFNRSYEYEFGDKIYYAELELSRSRYNSYSSYQREYTYSGALPSDWETYYYRMFINEGDDDELIKEIIEKIRNNPKIKNEEGLLKAVISFVQTIPYDYKKIYDPERNANYPYETVYKNKGVCQDVSILLIKLLKELDYDVVGFVFDTANHIGVGVRCPSGYGNFGTDYCFIEATGITRIGYVPEEYGIYGGIKLDKNPKIIRFGGTKTYNGIIEDKKEQEKLVRTYGEDYLSMNNKQRKLIEKITSIEYKLDGLDAEYKRKDCEGVIYIGTAKERICNRLYEEINGYVDYYNELAAEFNNYDR